MHLPAWALAIAERLAFRGEANRDVVGMLDAFTLLFSFLSLAASVATFLLSWRKPPVEEAAEVNGSGESNVSSSRRKEEQEEVPIARRLAHADQTPTELPGVPDAVGPEDGEEFSQRIEKFPDELPFNHDRWEVSAGLTVPALVETKSDTLCDSFFFILIILFFLFIIQSSSL